MMAMGRLSLGKSKSACEPFLDEWLPLAVPNGEERGAGDEREQEEEEEEEYLRR